MASKCALVSCCRVVFFFKFLLQEHENNLFPITNLTELKADMSIVKADLMPFTVGMFSAFSEMWMPLRLTSPLVVVADQELQQLRSGMKTLLAANDEKVSDC